MKWTLFSLILVDIFSLFFLPFLLSCPGSYIPVLIKQKKKKRKKIESDLIAMGCRVVNNYLVLHYIVEPDN